VFVAFLMGCNSALTWCDVEYTFDGRQSQVIERSGKKVERPDPRAEGLVEDPRPANPLLTEREVVRSCNADDGLVTLAD